ncbi:MULTISPECIES: phosphodiester glycosidase family protein [Marinovum]|uniref:phosphodiester glycosidase family protein n=1 Tax=Marinovum TaxID=367771 RepID=UPI00237B0F33|nr:phosphodiester glycosidase family protein [Marinovum sp. PR37]MDD9742989.1 phosphodiester glycosidase family protein [Marinovum sp. PR37]
MRLRGGLTALLLLVAAPAMAVTCSDERYEGNRFTVCKVSPGEEELRLYRADEAGAPYGTFANLERAVQAEGKQLRFATNGGMYHDDRAPVGHYIEEGEEEMRVIANEGPGNFGLLPNGVLCLRPGRADVIETRRYLDQAPDCRYATQSGPMLVIDGDLHPDFLPDGTSRFIRNGVGTSGDGKTAYFVISNNTVTFWEFASFFRDVLGVPQALFLDGNVSRLHAPDIGRSDLGFPMGPIVAVVVPDP